MNIVKIAELAYEVNRSYCRMIGDNSRPIWANAPDWQKESAISGVRFHFANPATEPSHSHDEWLATKKAHGWKYGPVKDVFKKEHPYFVPYDKLSIEQRLKSSLLAAVVDICRPLITEDV